MNDTSRPFQPDLYEWLSDLDAFFDLQSSGVVSHSENPPWPGRSVVLTISICLPIVLTMVVIRVYEKCYRTRKWTLDDSIFLLSFASAIAFLGLGLAVICGGVYGYHSWDVRIKDLTETVYLRITVMQITAGLFGWLVKLALFSLIYHAFKPLTYIRWLVYFGVSITGLFHIATVAVNLMICTPRHRRSDVPYVFTIPFDTCGSSLVSILAWTMTTAAVNLFSDLYLLALPIPAILRLSLPLHKKCGILLIFSTGISGCVMSALAVYYRKRWHEAWRADIFYDTIPVVIVTAIETALGVMIPCMAACAKLFHRNSGRISSFINRNLAILLPASLKSGQPLKNDQVAHEECEIGNDAPKMDTIDMMILQIRVPEYQTESDLENGSDVKSPSGKWREG